MKNPKKKHKSEKTRKKHKSEKPEKKMEKLKMEEVCLKHPQVFIKYFIKSTILIVRRKICICRLRF